MKRSLFTAIYLIGSLALFSALASCNQETPAEPETTTAINVGSSVRSSENFASKADPLSGHQAMIAGTQVRFNMEGKWVGHSPSTIVKYTTGTAAEDTDHDNINVINFTNAEKVYWDQFGVADPANKEGREEGISIYAAAANGVTTAPAISDWEHFEWAVKKDGSQVMSKDLVYANNISGEHKYKYDKRDEAGANRLDFHHALSMVTFNLTAGEGFPESGGVHSFESDPQVTLSLNKSGETATEYCLTQGHINILNGEVHQDEGSQAAVKAQKTATSATKVVTCTALIFPGTKLGRNSDSDLVATVIADKNQYYIKAAKMRKAMEEAEAGTDYRTKQGYNYVFNITVQKGEIKVTASIEEWKVVTSEMEEAQVVFNNDVVVVSGETGTKITANGASFSLYMSSTSTMGDVKTTPTYDPAAESGAGAWINNPRLFWPNTTDSQYFRALAEPDADKTIVASTDNVINQGTSAKDILWGTTSAHKGTEEGGTEHNYAESAAINPRTGNVPLVFYHAASLLTVNLSTATDERAVTLTDARVSITNLYTTGTLNIYDKSFAYGTKAATAIDKLAAKNYPVSGVTTLDSFQVVPQTFGDDSKVIITLADGTSYSKQLNKCLVEGSTTSYITKWDNNHHYVYNIYVEKASVDFSARIQDWTVSQGGGTADLDWD